MIKITTDRLADINAHAEAAYPHECCGLLIGRLEDEGQTRVVVETYAVENSWAESAALDHRMRITPADYLRAEREFAKLGLGVVGNYHSHPEHPAEPSQFDLEHLAPWPTMSYVVVSVRAGQATDLRSWALAADGSRFIEEEISKGN